MSPIDSIKKAFRPLPIIAWILFYGSLQPVGAQLEHPRVWIKAADRPALLEKIENEEYAASLFDQMRARIESVVEEHQQDRDAFIRGLPLDWSDGTDVHPKFPYINYGGEDESNRAPLMHYLQEAIECGIVYFVTGEEKYAQTAADVMGTIVSAMARVERIQGGGLLYPSNASDHLKEARIFGAQVPVACDFIYSYVMGGAQVYDVVTGTDRPFPFEDAQKVFKTYADMTLELGSAINNWTVLESPSLVQNLLMFDSQQEIDAYLPYYLTRGTPNQGPLSRVAQNFAQPGDVWPESLQYSLYVTELTLTLMSLLDRWDPDLNLAEKYPNIIASAGALHDLRFPNEDLPALGDGLRYQSPPYASMELAYYLAALANDEEAMFKFGSLLKSAMAAGRYSRSSLPGRSLDPEPYFTPIKLLWTVPDLIGQVQDYPRSRTAELPFAGLFLQRNLSDVDEPLDESMMLVVSGASYVHSSASGMAVEFYGLGEVIGTAGGVGTYTTEIHENYYRLFAAHNTVISNGASATSGGWAGLGMESVKLVSMEPLPGDEAISPMHSFSTTSFWDRHNLVHEADHQRTLALIRTSPTTGYYVDIFRARSDTPDEFHDYIYRNSGQSFDFVDTPANFTLEPTPERFQASAELPWSRNGIARHPGWHYLSDVSTAGDVDGPVVGKFVIPNLVPRTIFEIMQGITKNASMDVHMTGGNNRSYTKALSPPSKFAPSTQVDLHTLVVRQEGEAWSDPFAHVFESYLDDSEGPSVQLVEKLMDGGEFKGLVVESLVEGETLRQYILNPDDATAPYSNPALGITFTGHFAVVTADAQGELVSLYIGDGDSLEYKGTVLTADSVTKAAYYDPSEPVLYESATMGWLEYSKYPYVYSYDLDSWIYHPYSSIDQIDSSWYYIFKP